MKLAKPIIVLTVICLITSTCLALTNMKTEDAIAQVNKQKIAEAAAQVLPKGTKGEAVQGVGKSFGGDLTVMVGIADNGKITGVTVTDHADTPGLGTKAMTVDYLKQYKGLSKLPADHIKNDKQVDAITGATISSNGVYNAVKDALKKGGK
ncbi:MAG: FMN-binding protein [Eubacteriaceae bacterium]|nr:FMN-binding protein [Eubacteriaceae bacterium]